MMRWFSFWIFLYSVAFGTNGIIVPDEIPTALSVIYSNIPKIKLGTDSRIGWGFRFGDRADAQILLELGPQQYTQRLANQQPFDNPNYPELSSSLDSEDDYNYETSDDENEQEKEEDTGEDRITDKNETEAAVIRVEIEAMGNLISKLTNTVNNTTQSESADKENEVKNDLIHTLEVKMNEEKAKLKKLELTSVSPEENVILEQEENSSDEELREIIDKLKKYVDKATKTRGGVSDNVATLEIETLNRLILNLSAMSKLENGQDKRETSNEDDSNKSIKDSEIKEAIQVESRNIPKNETIKEKIASNSTQNNESAMNENSTEKTTEHSNTSNDKLKVIQKINLTEETDKTNVKNDAQPLTQENNEIAQSKIREPIEQNKELRNIDYGKTSSEILPENVVINKSSIELKTSTNPEKIIINSVMQQKNVVTTPNDQLKVLIQDKKQIKFKEINEDIEKFQKEISEDIEDKKEFPGKRCNLTETRVEDDSEGNLLKFALKKLRIKLNQQLEHLNLKSKTEEQNFMNNLKILKILEEEINGRKEKNMNKSPNGIILEGSYRGVSLKAYQTLSALWVKQDSINSENIFDSTNTKISMEQNFNNTGGSLDQGKLQNVSEAIWKYVVNSENSDTKSNTSSIKTEVMQYNEKNETVKYKSVNATKKPNEDKKVNNATKHFEVEQNNKTKNPDLKSTNTINDEEYKKTMATMIKAQVPRKNFILGNNINIPQKNEEFQRRIKMNNIPTSSSIAMATKKVESNLAKKNSPIDIKSIGSRMMAYFSKMLQDAKKLNEKKKMMKKRRIRGLSPER